MRLFPESRLRDVRRYLTLIGANVVSCGVGLQRAHIIFRPSMAGDGGDKSGQWHRLVLNKAGQPEPDLQAMPVNLPASGCTLSPDSPLAHRP